ncbi:MAG: hypothetical protein ACP5RP_01715 [Candidatus Micrarchaeia archaeon]
MRISLHRGEFNITSAKSKEITVSIKNLLFLWFLLLILAFAIAYTYANSEKIGISAYLIPYFKYITLIMFYGNGGMVLGLAIGALIGRKIKQKSNGIEEALLVCAIKSLKAVFAYLLFISLLIFAAYLLIPKFSISFVLLDFDFARPVTAEVVAAFIFATVSSSSLKKK